MLDINERIAELYNTSRHRSVSAFARSIEAKIPTITDTIKGNSEPRFSLLESILKFNPDISAEWLMRGEGSMCKSQQDISGSDSANVTTNADLAEDTGCDETLAVMLQEQLAEKDEHINSLTEKIRDKDEHIKKLLGFLEQKLAQKGVE